jgi:membrane associated rhomboid family serine protease
LVAAESRLIIAKAAVESSTMLEDRDYMRQPEYPEPRWTPRFHFQWSWTVALLLAYAVVFLVELAAQHFVPDNHFFHGYKVLAQNGPAFMPGFLPLSTEGLAHGYAWQLVTYQFLHAGWVHLLLNCWVIYAFGRELEALLGAKRFLALMFSSGIVGGVFQVLVAWAWPLYFGGPVVGASACAFGLVAAFAMMFPERELTLLIFFVIPVHLRAKSLLGFSAVLAVLGIVFNEYVMPGVAHAAHLGGMAMGWFYVTKVLKHPALIGAEDETPFIPPRRKRSKPAPPEEKSAGEFLESEVDPILDKISARGIQSLTPRERDILEQARKKMAQR